MTRDARLIETREVDLDDIEVEGRLRPVSPAAVNALRTSIEAIGLQSEIHLRKVAHQDGRLKLIAGGHRVVAFRKMGRDSIPAKIWDCTDDWATLAEIDDNLAHAELDTLELAVFLAERKVIYERMYPEARHGGDRGNQYVGGRQNDVLSFCQSVSQKRDLSERQVQRLVAAGEGLDKQALVHLRGAPKKVTLADLQIIAKCPPDDRPVICRELGLGKAKSAKEVLNRRKDGAAQRKDPAEAQLHALNDKFLRASKAVRLRFVRQHYGDLASLMDQIGTEGAEAQVVPFKARERG